MWFNEKGDSTYRLNYPSLNKNSLVLDLGGYKGDFTYEITKKYDCNVMVFEPVPKFAKFISERFSDNSKVKIFCFGLEDRNSEEELYMAADVSSVYKSKNSPDCISIKYKDVLEFFEEQHISNVDLMKINIEGGEYNLLEKMISSGLISKVDNLQVQFHDIKALDSENRMKKIWFDLEKTHMVTWKFRPFVWENWKRCEK